MLIQGTTVYNWSDLVTSLVFLGITVIVISATILQAKFLTSKVLPQKKKTQLMGICLVGIACTCFAQPIVTKAITAPAPYCLFVAAIMVQQQVLSPLLKDEGTVRCDTIDKAGQGKAAGVLTSSRGIGQSVAPLIVSAVVGTIPMATCSIVAFGASGAFVIAYMPWLLCHKQENVPSAIHPEEGTLGQQEVQCSDTIMPLRKTMNPLESGHDPGGAD
jgi:hypothetical protein